MKHTLWFIAYMMCLMTCISIWTASTDAVDPKDEETLEEGFGLMGVFGNALANNPAFSPENLQKAMDIAKQEKAKQDREEKGENDDDDDDEDDDDDDEEEDEEEDESTLELFNGMDLEEPFIIPQTAQKLYPSDKVNHLASQEFENMSENVEEGANMMIPEDESSSDSCNMNPTKSKCVNGKCVKDKCVCDDGFEGPNCMARIFGQAASALKANMEKVHAHALEMHRLKHEQKTKSRRIFLIVGGSLTLILVLFVLVYLLVRRTHKPKVENDKYTSHIDSEMNFVSPKSNSNVGLNHV